MMCQIMGVSKSQYDAWLTKPKTTREAENERLMEKIQQLFAEGRQTYGTRRLKKKLAEQGLIVSRRRIGRLLKKAGLSCKTKRKFKATTDSTHANPT